MELQCHSVSRKKWSPHKYWNNNPEQNKILQAQYNIYCDYRRKILLESVFFSFKRFSFFKCCRRICVSSGASLMAGVINDVGYTSCW